ncbi:17734_t:CDS:2, partial [Dentiscutata erythropus]
MSNSTDESQDCSRSSSLDTQSRRSSTIEENILVNNDDQSNNIQRENSLISGSSSVILPSSFSKRDVSTLVDQHVVLIYPNSE